MTESNPDENGPPPEAPGLVDQVNEIVPGAWNEEEHLPIGDEDGPAPEN